MLLSLCLICIMALIGHTGSITEIQNPGLNKSNILAPWVITSVTLGTWFIYSAAIAMTMRQYGDS